MSRQPVYTYNGCWIICEKVRGEKKYINHLGTPQNNLGTPLGVPTPSLRTTVLIDRYITVYVMLMMMIMVTVMMIIIIIICEIDE